MSLFVTRRHHINTTYHNYVLTATSFLALLAAGAANAQTATAQTVPAASADTPVEEIVVTGTQIRGVAPVGAPVITVDQDEIVQSGANSTSDIIHDIPQVTSLGAGQGTLGANQAANLNTNKANAINIRGLGDQATLTLLDGRRVAPGGPGAQLFDPSSIPTIALSNIDVVADGASATYGSDAVAGVANLVLRKDFEGADVEARYGVADSYETRKFDAIIGHKWDGGSAMVALESNENNQMTEGKRLGFFNCNEIQYGGTNSCLKYSNPGNITVPAGASLPAGTYGLPVNSTGAAVTAGQLKSVNYFNQALDTTLIPSVNRKSFIMNVQQKVTDSINLWAEGYYTDDHVSYENGVFQASGTVKNTNPNFIPLGAGVTSESFNVGLDPYVGTAVRAGYEHSYQGAGGVDVNLFQDWQLNAYYEHNGNSDRLQSGSINTTAEATAVACTVPGICFDPFGLAAGNAAAVGSFIGYNDQRQNFLSDLGNAKVDGTVFTLPGGDVKLAIGGEVHRDTFSAFNTATTLPPNASTIYVTTNYASSRTVHSVYAEGIIPIVGANNSLPFINRLDVDLAGRYDKYSDVGTTINPKYALRWKPIQDLTLHASYGTSFRAPTLCDTNSQCTAAVISAPAYGGPVGGAPYNVLTIVGGNSNVKPEKARTYSVGSDYKPSWLRGFDIGANFYYIDYRNVIGTPAATNPAVFTQSALYSSFVTLHPNAAQLAAVTSLPFYTGGVPFPITPASVYAIVDGTRHNVGAIHTNGLDLTASYDWSNSLGDWTVGATASYMFEYNYQLLPGSPYIDRLNQANYPVQFRSRAKLGWSDDDFSATAYVNYTGGYNVVQLVSLTTGPQNQKVDAFTTIDGTLLYKLHSPSWGGGYADNITVSLSVENLLDKNPPFALVATTYQFDSQAANPLGRLITLGIRKSF